MGFLYYLTFASRLNRNDICRWTQFHVATIESLLHTFPHKQPTSIARHFLVSNTQTNYSECAVVEKIKHIKSTLLINNQKTNQTTQGTYSLPNSKAIVSYKNAINYIPILTCNDCIYLIFKSQLKARPIETNLRKRGRPHKGSTRELICYACATNTGASTVRLAFLQNQGMNIFLEPVLQLNNVEQ